MITQKVVEASAKVEKYPFLAEEERFHHSGGRRIGMQMHCSGRFCGGKMSSRSMTSVFSMKYESGSSLRGGCVGGLRQKMNGTVISQRGRNLTRFLSSSECRPEVSKFCISPLGCVTLPNKVAVKSREDSCNLRIAVMNHPRPMVSASCVLASEHRRKFNDPIC